MTSLLISLSSCFPWFFSRRKRAFSPKEAKRELEELLPSLHGGDQWHVRIKAADGWLACRGLSLRTTGGHLCCFAEVLGLRFAKQAFGDVQLNEGFCRLFWGFENLVGLKKGGFLLGMCFKRLFLRLLMQISNSKVGNSLSIFASTILQYRSSAERNRAQGFKRGIFWNQAEVQTAWRSTPANSLGYSSSPMSPWFYPLKGGQSQRSQLSRLSRQGKRQSLAGFHYNGGTLPIEDLSLVTWMLLDFLQKNCFNGGYLLVCIIWNSSLHFFVLRPSFWNTYMVSRSYKRHLFLEHFRKLSPKKPPSTKKPTQPTNHTGGSVFRPRPLTFLKPLK